MKELNNFKINNLGLNMLKNNNPPSYYISLISIIASLIVIISYFANLITLNNIIENFYIIPASVFSFLYMIKFVKTKYVKKIIFNENNFTIQDKKKSIIEYSQITKIEIKLFEVSYRRYGKDSEFYSINIKTNTGKNINIISIEKNQIDFFEKLLKEKNINIINSTVNETFISKIIKINALNFFLWPLNLN